MKSRTKDISYSNTPIAKDSTGTYFYKQDGKNEDRDIISLLSNNL